MVAERGRAAWPSGQGGGGGGGGEKKWGEGRRGAEIAEAFHGSPRRHAALEDFLGDRFGPGEAVQIKVKQRECLCVGAMAAECIGRR